jgi:methylated-DNA-[protein]-cysteine S-methyltransferase
MTELQTLLAESGNGEAVSRLRTELARRASAADLLDVAYRTLDTPVGQLLLATTPDGLVRVAYPQEGHDAVLRFLAENVSPRLLAAPRQLDVVARQIDEYFAGRRRSFQLDLDLRLRQGFRRQVLESLRKVPYGATVSYGQVADELSNPRATRAVGTACATNPLPVVIPCHRVVRSDGAPGGYIGGTAAKSLLLDLEAHRSGPARAGSAP